MSKKKKNKGFIPLIIISAALVLFAVSFSIVSRYPNKVPKNPQGTVGNTAGNIYNQGLFCENDGKVYFANSYDSGSLYSMNPDETEVKKILNAKVQYINVAGKYIYYYMADSSTSTGLGFLRRVMGINRCKKNGRSGVTLTRDPSLEMILIDNSIYFLDYDKVKGVHLSKMSTDGKNDIDLSNSIINPAGVYGDVIYFTNNESNHFLMILDTADDSITEYVRINMWNPIRMGNYIYFMDIDHNYRLCRYSISDENVEILTKDRVDCFNLNTDYIYYQKNDAKNPCLKRITIDGSSEEIIKSGNYTAINLTDRYVYFQPFENNTITYKTPAYGSINVTEFDAAISAVFD
ncbi:MAG: DUF5050 domain-containing protein [Lachnospiraceae bacterium]|nr:DUF5050 domain-containing protein [Lachnospiraceae bacterium]